MFGIGRLLIYILSGIAFIGLIAQPATLHAPVEREDVQEKLEKHLEERKQIREKEQKTVSWVDSVYNSLSDRERIGQLFMIRAHSNLGLDHIKQVEKQIADYHIGGLCFFQGTPEKQLELSIAYQKLSSKIPLMIAIDGEWGLGMRFKAGIINYPRNLMLGAIDDNNLIYSFGRAIGRHLKRIGVHINFGPVVDINNNPGNPVINDRSFGEDKYNVVTKSYMYMIGLQDEGVMACAKHFPGHGDTKVDSHYDLPVISHSRERLDELELFPFQMLSDNGLQSIMVAHVHMPALDSTPNMPTTLSPAVVDTLLKQEMGFKGLIFTDALEMKGVTKHFQVGDIERRAFLAGNDVLLLPNDLSIAFQTIESLIDTSTYARNRLEESVKKILRAKYQLELFDRQTPSFSGLYEDLNKYEDYLLKEELVSNAITLIGDEEELIPLAKPENLRVATLMIGNSNWTAFQNVISFYTAADHYQIGMSMNATEIESISKKLKNYDIVLIGLYPGSRLPKNKYNISDAALGFINTFRSQQKTILSIFGNPYILRYVQPNQGPIIVAYENDETIESAAAQAIFGAKSMSGRLPITAGVNFPYLSGKSSRILDRLQFSDPRALGMNMEDLAIIDTITKEMTGIQAAPGAQLLAIKDNQVFIHRAIGFTTYDKSIAINTEMLYDLASITKLAATTLSIMKLYETGIIHLDSTLGHYIKELAGTDKSKLTIREVLAHRAGLHAWIPFYKSTITMNGKKPLLNSELYSETAKPGFARVANNIYIDTSYWEVMWSEIAKSKWNPDKKYVYSDLGFILFAKLVKNVSGMGLDEYVSKHFYQPMGLTRLMFNPLDRFSKDKIAPTEEDQYYRSQLLIGHVHDMGAAMLGGVSGHAGLFGNAADLGKLMYMFYNGGVFNGNRYLKQETVDLFTTRYSGDTRRGLGFDMQETKLSKGMNVTRIASSSTFGHTGFTGTCAWADPECGIVYVFLSNRVHPDMENRKLIKYEHRLRAHYQLYKAMGE